MNEQTATFFDMEACRKCCPLFKEHKGARLVWHENSRDNSGWCLWVKDPSGQIVHECGCVGISGDSLFEMMFIAYDDLENCIGKAEVMVYDANN